jgi:Flp pilus assembly protein TadG
MVTVELAIGFLAVVAMLVLVVSVAAVGLTRSSVCQAVREAAREASVGGDAHAAAARASEGSVNLAVSRAGRWVTVRGQAPVAGPVGGLGATARCEATTLVEQAVP